jgi:septum formation protein
VDKRPGFPSDFQLLLASQSPRRHAFLQELAVPFSTVESAAVEILTGVDVRTVAEANALAKLKAAVLPKDVEAGAFVLATDTIVALGGEMMGKASSEVEAQAMLAELSGRMHQVVSGVALGRLSGDKNWGSFDMSSAHYRSVMVDSALTDVTFSELDDDDIAAYVASGEWEGKAGAYAIQGLAGLYVSDIRGEYSNVVGLPLNLLGRMFREQGFDLVRRTWV